jgi:ATP-dependent Clp protease ATP-binding subunit ClpC
VFERYSTSAVRVLRLSLEEARARGSASIRTEHLLLGVLRVNDHIAKTIFERAGVSIEALEQEMSEPQSPIPESVDVPWHSESSRVLQHAAAEAEHSQGRLLADYVLADDHIGPEHLLLGLLRENHAAAAAMLGRYGVTLDLARDEVLRQSRSRSVSE